MNITSWSLGLMLLAQLGGSPGTMSDDATPPERKAAPAAGMENAAPANGTKAPDLKATESAPPWSGTAPKFQSSTPGTDIVPRPELVPRKDTGSPWGAAPKNDPIKPAEGNPIQQPPARQQVPQQSIQSSQQRTNAPATSNTAAPGWKGAGDSAAPESKLVPVQGRSSAEAAALLEQTLSSQANGAISGRPFPLVQVLSRTGQRMRQLRATRAYWRLASELAEHNWAAEENEQLAQVQPQQRPLDQAALKAAQTAATARLHEVELAALAAQFDLAEQMLLPASDPLPLIEDQPHVGNYKTYIDNVYAGQIPPTRSRLIDRALPIRRNVIDVRAGAVQAAGAGFEQCQAAYKQGQLDIVGLLDCHERLRTARREFLGSVRDYNYDIAEYALTAASPTATETMLVGMLIRPKVAQRSSPSPAGSRAPTAMTAPELPPEGATVPATAEQSPELAQPGLRPDASVQPAEFQAAPDARPIDSFDRSRSSEGPAGSPRQAGSTTQQQPGSPSNGNPAGQLNNVSPQPQKNTVIPAAGVEEQPPRQTTTGTGQASDSREVRSVVVEPRKLRMLQQGNR